ncbi:MAG: hypothetical protein GJ676_21070 [Rhodobacteraceae bacterium]|nr:hypothetical protein [Paracoccaceae bacterium]
MKTIPLTAFLVTGLTVLGACGGGKSAEPSLLSQCVSDAGIDGEYQVETVVTDEGTTRTVLPGKDVSKKQAKKANTCLAK